MNEIIKEFLIETCPSCGEMLSFDGIHLLCENKKCVGRISKQLSTNVKLIDIKGIGPKTIENFAADFEDLIDVIEWVRKYGNTINIEKYGIKFNSRTHELFLSSFNNIKSITYAQSIVLLGFNNVGLKLAEQIARFYFDKQPDFSGHDKSIVLMLCSNQIKEKVQNKVNKLIQCGITVDAPINDMHNEASTFICMTGSPKSFGFATKEAYLKEFNGDVIEVSLTDKNCKYLVTDDYNSNSNKMITAKKKNIEIFTYEDFINKLKRQI